MKGRVVHLYIMKGSENDGIYCGKSALRVLFSISPHKVTCKRCLRGAEEMKCAEHQKEIHDCISPGETNCCMLCEGYARKIERLWALIDRMIRFTPGGNDLWLPILSDIEDERLKS